MALLAGLAIFPLVFANGLDPAEGPGLIFVTLPLAFGHMPAGALFGTISGSGVANVATTGSFTIPLMKKVGYPGKVAAATEVAASTNGQLMPPVMGAAAFLMVEYVNIPYIDVVKHAFLPAVISYIALLYIVHLEALKMNMKGLTKADIDNLFSE